MKKYLKYLILLASLFFSALNFNYFLKPLNLVTGGNQGLAILLNRFFTLKPSTIILIINIFALIISYLFLNKEITRSALISTFIYPLFIRLTSYFPTLTLNNDMLVYAIIAGIICGLTGGYIYKMGFSSGGLSILNILIKKYLHLKISLSNFIINTIIIILGCFIFGLKKALYSILIITIGSLIIYSLIKAEKKKQETT